MLGQGPLSGSPLSTPGGAALQSTSITGTGGLATSGAATTKRGATITATSGLRLTGAATITSLHWRTSASRSARPPYENRRIVLQEDQGATAMVKRLEWPEKDPDEELTYTISWGDLLGDDPIASVDWTVEAGLTGGTEVRVGYVTGIRLSGGTAGVTYGVQCEVTTEAGLVYSRTILLEVATR